MRLVRKNAIGGAIALVAIAGCWLAWGGADWLAHRHAAAFCDRVELGEPVAPLDAIAHSLDGWNAGGTGPSEWPGRQGLIFTFEGDQMYQCLVAIEMGKVVAKRRRTVPKS